MPTHWPRCKADVEIETLGERVAQKYADSFMSKLAHKLATVEAKALVDTLADTRPERDRDTWLDTG